MELNWPMLTIKLWHIPVGLAVFRNHGWWEWVGQLESAEKSWKYEIGKVILSLKKKKQVKHFFLLQNFGNFASFHFFYDWQLIFLPVGVGVRHEGWLMKGQYRLEECSLVQHSSALLLQQYIINKRSIGLLCSPCLLCLS